MDWTKLSTGHYSQTLPCGRKREITRHGGRWYVWSPCDGSHQSITHSGKTLKEAKHNAQRANH